MATIKHIVMNSKKILVGLSGGVDSSAAVLLLQEKGFEVITASILFSPRHKKDVDGAAALADELKTKHYEIDMQEEFESRVLSDFTQNYLSGCTPNPCIRCNPSVKFKALTAFADSLGIEKIATGHYAERVDIDGSATLLAAQNNSKDQSYMLYRLSPQTLKRVIFPLGRYDKGSIRDVARQHALSSAEKPDSQELCFCDNYIDFLLSRGKTPKSGSFILPDGSKLPHNGSYCYTVGQRKGLGVSYKHPLYVKNISEDADIELSCKDELFSDTIRINDTIFNEQICFNKDSLYCKIRSTASPTLCSLESDGDGVYTIKTESPVFAPSRGQSAVLYTSINDRLAVIGGGIIV